jgi:hypothetical protein
VENVANESLYDIWNSEQMNSLRGIHKRNNFYCYFVNITIEITPVLIVYLFYNCNNLLINFKVHNYERTVD